MFVVNDSLRIVDGDDDGDYSLYFKFYLILKQEMKSIKFKDTISAHEDKWNFLISWNIRTLSITLMNFSDSSNLNKGIWSVAPVDNKNTVGLQNNPSDSKLNQRILLRLAAIDKNVVAEFEVKLLVFKTKIITDESSGSNQETTLISTDALRLYEEIEQASDIQIIAGDNETVAVHKSILTMRSSVFYAMFNGYMTESNSNKVQIPDFDVITIRRMVEFLYKDTFTDIDGTSYKDLLSLLKISDKYEIISLKEASSGYIKTKITVDNVAELRIHALVYDSVDLLYDCLQFIESNSSQLFKDDNFLSKCNTPIP